jgi:predicted dehydrogenase
MKSSTPSHSVDRRTFVKAVSAAGIGLAMAGAPTAQGASSNSRRRYAIVGCGARYSMFQNAIHGTYKEHAELVGLCDSNPGRLEMARQKSADAGAEVPGYAPDDFEKMIDERKVGVVIVTTVDSTHHHYIIGAMNAGCDVITEKPMTTTADACQQIIDARARTGKQCRVTFNYRYSPPRTQIKELLMSGEIGDVLSVDFNWLLNTHHGADYFRRWHRRKEFSGGLMIHKATHHFDLVNWWLGAVPLSVFATGKREFYTPAMAKRMGLTGPHERCLSCPEKEKCSFRLDLAANAGLKRLYLDHEHHDGYFRDRCVWSDQIDIEDTMNVLVKYDNSVTLAYSLNAFNSWEGYTIAFNGTRGRIEHSAVEQIYISGTGAEQGAIKPRGIKTLVIPLRGPAREIEPWKGEGGHGGGDKLLLDDLFLPSPEPDKYLRAADERAGAASILVGVAANRCFETGQPVTISELVTGLEPPDYATMPSRTGPLPMP